jgi:hypothetical protein
LLNRCRRRRFLRACSGWRLCAGRYRPRQQRQHQQGEESQSRQSKYGQIRPSAKRWGKQKIGAAHHASQTQTFDIGL